MQLREFLKSLPLFPSVALAKVKPKGFGKRVFPKKPEEFIGKICVSTCDCDFHKLPPFLIVREWDEDHDRYKGELIDNPRRNKYWGEPVKGENRQRQILCIMWYPPYLLDDMEFYEPS